MNIYTIYLQKDLSFKMCKSGKYYGYPKCCIKQFDNDLKTGICYVNRTDRIKASKNGFIPCDNHALLINKGFVTITSILVKRLCPRPLITI